VGGLLCLGRAAAGPAKLASSRFAPQLHCSLPSLQPLLSQVLSTRARKDVTLASIKVQVCVFAFDCLSINGRTLLQEPLTARREALFSALEESKGHLEFATAKVRQAGYSSVDGLCASWPCIACMWPAVLHLPACLRTAPAFPGRALPYSFCLQTSRDIEELTRFLDESVEAGTEGLIVKTVAGGPSGRLALPFHIRPPGCACFAGLRVGVPALPHSAVPPTVTAAPACLTVFIHSPICPLPAACRAICCRLVRAQQAQQPLAEAEEGLPGGRGRHL
jgi:hypothetical protein